MASRTTEDPADELDIPKTKQQKEKKSYSIFIYSFSVCWSNIMSQTSSLLHKATTSQDVERALEAGENVEQREDDETPLMVACRKGNLEVVKSLLSHGAKTDNNSTSKGALSVASEMGYTEIVRCLLDHGADVNARSFDFELCKNQNALILACFSRHDDIAHLLLDHDADELIGSSGDSALTLACEWGNLKLVQRLISLEAKLSHSNFDEQTPLMIACTHGHTEIADALIEALRLENAKEQSWEISQNLVRSCNGGHLEATTRLLDLGDSLGLDFANGCSSYDVSYLMSACDGGNLNIVDLLVGRGAKINAVDSEGNTALDYTLYRGAIDVVDRLLSLGADINTPSQRVTTLLKACRIGNVDVIDRLLRHGANPNLLDEWNQSPLFAACRSGRLDVVDRLLCVGSDVNHVVNGGLTILMSACGSCNVEVVSRILSMGVDVNFQNEVGETALLMACKDGSVDVVKELLKHNARPEIATCDGNDSFQVASNEEIKTLLSQFKQDH